MFTLGDVQSAGTVSPQRSAAWPQAVLYSRGQILVARMQKKALRNRNNSRNHPKGLGEGNFTVNSFSDQEDLARSSGQDHLFDLV